MERLLNQAEFIQALHCKTLQTAKRRLKTVGIVPRKMGRDLFITERQLLEAIEGREIPRGDGEFKLNLDGI